jgi:prophage regulatory protein
MARFPSGEPKPVNGRDDANRLPDRACVVARIGVDDARSRARSTGSWSEPALTSPTAPPPLKLIRFPVVRDRTGLSRSTIWRLERRGDFPRHFRIAPNVVAWVEEEVAGWIQARASRVPA